MNYVFLGDSPTLETGFARVTKNIVSRLDLPNIHFWGIGYNGMPHDFSFNIYPANLNSSWESEVNFERFKEFLETLEGDITLWMIHDPFRLNGLAPILREIKKTRNLKIIGYTPVDGYLTQADCEPYLSVVDVPVAYTEFGKNQLNQFTDKNILVIPHGSDIAFRKKEVDKAKFFGTFLDKKILGVVNSNSPRKNLFRSLEIFKHLYECDHSWILYIHSDPDGYLNLKKIALDLGIIDKCVFADPFFQDTRIGNTNCDKETLIDIYNCFDAYLSTSHGEGWGLTATEAASCEVPIILGRHTSFAEIFDEDSCLFLEQTQPSVYANTIVPDFDSYKSALKIFDYFEDFDEVLRRKENAKKIVDSFSWDQISKKWQNIIKPKQDRPVVISTGMRVGSTWVGMMSAAIQGKTEERVYIDKFLDLSRNNLEEKKQLITEFIQNAPSHKWMKSHSITPDFFSEITNLDDQICFINVVRNKEDAIRSRYFYSRYHEPSRGGSKEFEENYKGDLNQTDEQIIQELWNTKPPFFQEWLNQYEAFNKVINNENVLTLDYDKLNAKDKHEMEKLLEFLGRYEIDPLNVYEQFSFEAMQKHEIETSGRNGKELFHREGGRDAIN